MTKKFGGLELIELQPKVPSSVISPWLYCLLTSCGACRDDLIEMLASQGIDSRPFFIPLHSMPPFAGARIDGALPVTLDLSARGLNIPTFPEMTDREIDRVVSGVLSSPIFPVGIADNYRSHYQSR